MAKQEYLNFLDFTKGLYEKALRFLEPGSDDFSILSGAVLLTVGLEKFVKYVLYTRHPFMVLYNKIDGFEDVIKLEQGETFANCNTISFEVALERLVKLYPELSTEAKDIKYIIEKRNYLMHNFGYIEIGNLEKRIQTKIADMSEAICDKCLQKHPQEIFTKEIWNEMAMIREAYKNAEVLEIEKRIKHLKRLYSKGQSLPCEKVEISNEIVTIEFTCPICEDAADIGIKWEFDIDVDHREGTILGAWEIPYPMLIKCGCGFTMNDPEEIEIVLGDKYKELIDYCIAQKQEEPDFYDD
ncbi:hypothetical protein C7Y66_27205 [Chroococcidiopsis sp. CCALA 051]|uniref:hypothetical protein n=1 Tax=Chroococcidiopsis sp. CCALA 051 TaxID=869949 RepID=UPI000D0DEA64|nr:hypothetical protein [Chroococcidiopsis sp. CCALA 051]PSM46026.1 hypothetical protein C7Y66_27205 [Chroococcidiopsis sp. CCALA 051]